MKKILTLTVAVLGLALSANAQKNIDLQLTALVPVNGDVFPNLNAGDSFYIYGVVQNIGTDTVTPTDTIQFNTGGFASDNAEGYEIFNRWRGLTILPGASDTLGILIRQGQNFGAGNSGNITAKFPRNSTDTIYAYVNGESVAEGPYSDPGYDVNAEDPLDVNGNNLFFAIVTFGNPTSIKGLEKNNSTLKVFPNPANNQVSFTNDFTVATTASVRITDIAGRVVKSMDLGKQNTGAKTFNIDIADLNNGMYYLELVTETTRSISKFTKQ